MHAALENIIERPLSHKIAFWVGSLLFFTYMFWQFFYKEKVEEQTKLETKIEELNTKIAQEKRIARDLKRIRAEVKVLEVKLKIALQELPDKKEIPDLLEQVSTLARKAGLEVGLFKPSPEEFRDFYARVPVSVVVEGSFHQVASFFDEVGHLNRIVNIDNIVLREPKITEQLITLKADCTATTFRYLEESERIKSPTEDAQKKRRR